MDGYYDENLVNSPDKEAILLQFHDVYQNPVEGTEFMRNEEISNVNNQGDSPRHINPVSFAYYQQYFNVNTEDVLQRIKLALLPNIKVNYYESQIKARPDLYGPIWVCLTLAFSIAIGSNLVDYFTSRDTIQHWKYDFHVITKALFVLFVYSWIIPLILWSLSKWYLSSQVNVSVLELICTYGYALVIYIPLSICWIVHVPYLQWILLLVGTTSSGIVLISTMQPMVSKENVTVLAAIVVLHIFFTVLIFLMFFHVN